MGKTPPASRCLDCSDLTCCVVDEFGLGRFSLVSSRCSGRALGYTRAAVGLSLLDLLRLGRVAGPLSGRS